AEGPLNIAEFAETHGRLAVRMAGLTPLRRARRPARAPPPPSSWRPAAPPPPPPPADDADGMFREPYVDSDEQREQPVPHRYVHGGFRGTQTRFSFYLPPESLYRDRFFTVVEGGQAGHEDRAAQMRHRHLPSIAWAIASGGYLVESNGGHVAAATLSYTHGSDEPSITAYRATAAATRFAREFATNVYRRRPRYGYVLGGS